MRTLYWVVLWFGTALVVSIVFAWREPSSSAQVPHRSILELSRHAFCNCMKTATPLEVCLTSAETGPAFPEVKDIDLLTAPCMNALQISRFRPSPPSRP